MCRFSKENYSSSVKDAWIRCRIPRKSVSGQAEASSHELETISFVLVGGISVLMCLSVEKAKSRVQESGWSPDLLEVVLG